MNISILGILILVTLASCNDTGTNTGTGGETSTAPAGLTDLAVAGGLTTADSIWLTWSQPTAFGTTDGTTAALFGSYAVRVYQGADDSGREVEDLTLTPSPLDENTTRVRVSGLSSDTQYAFKLVLSNDNDPSLSSDSNVVSGTTTEEGVPTAPAGLRDLAVTEASVTVDTVELTWSLPASFGTTDGIMAARFGSYAVKVYEGADDSGSEVEGLTLTPSSLDESTVSVRVSGLSSDTQYAFKLVLSNGNDSPLSSDSNVVTATSQDPTGRIWTKVSVNSDIFSERRGPVAVIFKNKLWIIGGYDGVTRFNDVWSSPDGKSWTEVATNDADAARFTGRYEHAAVVFDDKLWVIGGNDGNDGRGGYKRVGARTNDVWSSPDGKSWTEETKGVTTPRFAERNGHTAVVFDGKIWVIGGYSRFYGIYSTTYSSNDVWSSSDGKSWTRETSGITKTGRRYLAAAVFDGKLWIIGGLDGVARFNDVWSSPDGKSWTEVTKDVTTPRFSGRNTHAVVAFDGKLWVLGGFDGSDNNEVWSSPDGKSWTEVTEGAKTTRFSRRNRHAAAVFDNKLWVIGGNSASSDTNDVLHSP